MMRFSPNGVVFHGLLSYSQYLKKKRISALGQPIQKGWWRPLNHVPIDFRRWRCSRSAAIGSSNHIGQYTGPEKSNDNSCRQTICPRRPRRWSGFSWGQDSGSCDKRENGKKQLNIRYRTENFRILQISSGRQFQAAYNRPGANQTPIQDYPLHVQWLGHWVKYKIQTYHCIHLTFWINLFPSFIYFEYGNFYLKGFIQVNVVIFGLKTTLQK